MIFSQHRNDQWTTGNMAANQDVKISYLLLTVQTTVEKTCKNVQ